MNCRKRMSWKAYVMYYNKGFRYMFKKDFKYTYWSRVVAK